MFEIKNRNLLLRGLLPEEFDERTMYDLIGSVINPDLDALPGGVVFDFSKLQRIGAGGVAVLSNVIELLKRSNVAVSCENISPASKAFKQLRDFGFIEKYDDTRIIPDRNRWRLPLKIVHEERVYSYITNHLIPWIAAAFDAEEEQLALVTVSFQEIFNNIIDHSTVSIGCACAQYDKTHGLIRICVSDFGVGIPKHVRRAQPQISSDELAIAKACEHGFTTQSTPRNRGAGLHVILNSIVEVNQGDVAIYSSCGVYSVKSHAGRTKTTVRASRGFYPGTMFFITLNAKNFVPAAKQEHFEW